MPAPTLLDTNASVFNDATDKSATVNIQSGCLIVLTAAGEGTANDFNTPTNSGAALTWTKDASVDASGRADHYLWTATGDSTRSLTINVTDNSATNWWGVRAWSFTGTDGKGNPASGNNTGTGPSVNITTTQANSAIVVAVADFSAGTDTNPSWRTNAGSFTQHTGYDDAIHYSVYNGYHPDAGATGTYAVGWTGTATWSLVAVEVRGSSSVADNTMKGGSAGMFGLELLPEGWF